MTTSAACTPNRGWPIQRILFLIAGTVTLIGVLLSALFSPWFLLIPAMVGANQLLMVAAGWCPMSLLLTKLGYGDLQRSSVRSAA
jgi:hypothetical protein